MKHLREHPCFNRTLPEIKTDIPAERYYRNGILKKKRGMNIRLMKKLQNEGYYDSSMNYEINVNKDTEVLQNDLKQLQDHLQVHLSLPFM